jgi:hypothetical protein
MEKKRKKRRPNLRSLFLHMYRQSDSLMEGCEEAVCSIAREQDIL